MLDAQSSDGATLSLYTLGVMVSSVDSFYSDDLISNPAKENRFFSINGFKKNENK